MKRAVIIHGWNGSPQGIWIPWLKGELEKKGFQVSAPKMPDGPPSAEWPKILAELIGTPDSDLVLVGHSAGCITILRFLEKIDTAIAGAVLVAGFSDDLGMKEVDSLFETPIKWPVIRDNCKKFVAFNSDDDEYIPVEQGYLYKEKLGAELIIKKGFDHFTKIKEFPELLEAIEKMV